MSTNDASPAAPPHRSVAIIGAGLAGATAAAALREHGFGGTITLLGDERELPYDRPPLSKALLTRTDPAWLSAELAIDVTELCDTVLLGTRATGISWLPDGRATVAHSTGQPVTADAVIVATGSSAIVPHHLEAALPLRTAADAAAIRSALAIAANENETLPVAVVVIGAGWIGAELAGSIAQAGHHVTVVEAADHPLPAIGDVGATTASWYEAAGVTLLTGVRVIAADQSAVILDDTTVLAADIVIVAVGARPATAWLGDGWRRDAMGAVLVDGAGIPLEAPAPRGRVRVVGDAAARVSPRFGTIPSGHWHAAITDTRAAVADLLNPGAASDHDPTPELFSTQFGHTMVMVGVPRAGDVVTRTQTTRGWVAQWASPVTGRTTSDEQVTAVLAIDSPRDVSAARALLRGISAG